VHEHPEVKKGDAIPFTYMRGDIEFLHIGYVDEETRRARFRRNYPLLTHDMEQNPDRKLNAFLMLRDIAQSLQFEQEQTGGRVLEGQPERAQRGIELFEQVLDFKQIRLIVDSMPYYSLCVATIGGGFDVKLTMAVKHPGAQDLATSADITGRILSRAHLMRLLTIIHEESTKHYESKYL
jgi:hypothetical protein